MAAHVVVLDETHPEGAPGHMTLRCERCGIKVGLKMPLSVTEFCGISRGFGERHRDCSLVADEAGQTQRGGVR